MLMLKHEFVACRKISAFKRVRLPVLSNINNQSRRVQEIRCNSPAAKVKYQVSEEPPSNQIGSKFGCEKKSHDAVGLIIARLAYKIPVRVSIALPILPLQNTSPSSLHTTSRVCRSVCEISQPFLSYELLS